MYHYLLSLRYGVHNCTVLISRPATEDRVLPAICFRLQRRRLSPQKVKSASNLCYWKGKTKINNSPPS